MARKRRQEEPENHGRWMVSYADFLTLLFAFFVVMYAVSSVNEGKYRTLSQSLISAFQTPTRSLEPIQVGQLARSLEDTPIGLDDTPQNVPVPQQVIPTVHLAARSGGSGDLEQTLAEVSDQVVERMRPLIERGLVTVRRTELWMEVEINTSILFRSGSDELSDEAQDILGQIAEALAAHPHPIRVEGFTDTVPINNERFGSNWELSAARAVRVVRLLADRGIEPTRLAAMAFGEYRPVAENDTPEGRNQNRRVALVVLAEPDARYMMDISRERNEIRLDSQPAMPEGVL